MDSLLLGIDIGTTNTKALLMTPEGTIVAQSAVGGYPLLTPGPGQVEQSPEGWWQAACQAIRQAVASTPRGAERVAGLAVSSQAPTLLPLDAAGRPLRRALIWMDRRAEAEVAFLEALIGADKIYHITGNRPDAFYLAAKLLWFRNHEPQLLKQTRHFVQVNGYINYRLTGALSLDQSHAALLQLRDYASGAWSPELCGACGIVPEQLPAVYPGHHILGGVTAEAAEATGLRPGTPVMVGTVDSAAAALETGVAELGVAAEMTGTSTVLLMPNTTGITERAFIAMPHAILGMHLLLAAMVASGASLRWFRDQFGAAEVEAASRADQDAFDLLTTQAAQVAPGSEGVIFLPYMMGERSPLWHTQARGVLFGLSLATSKAAVVRAILEGTALALYHNVEIAQGAGVQLNEIRSVGGGARSSLWNQIKADVLGLPVILPEASGGAPSGDALLAGIGLGLYPDPLQAMRAIVKVKARYEPNPANHAKYRDCYGVFRSIYEHLRGDFDTAATGSIGKSRNDE